MSDTEFSSEKTDSFSMEKACKSHNLLKNLRSVIESHPDKSAKKFGMSIIHLLNDDECKMLDCLEFLAQIYPEIGLLHRRIAEIYINRNDFKTAVTYLEKALKLDKEDLTAKIWLGLGYFATGNEKKAKICLKSLSEDVFLLYASNSNLWNQKN